MEYHLYLVDYITEDGDNCTTVVKSTTHEEAFEIWRTVNMGLTWPIDEYYQERRACVFELGPEPEGVGILEIMTAGRHGETFDLAHDSLACKAIRATLTVGE